ncbi:hypothetical protein K7X08_006786 [Anisodus acutangulus]|uniref:Uncharacterized protein n=1 Tax=Anisodus acutangulus TaxID=402998 RepID=A0A9Q1RRY9_9SOLA|nr:hypothetical protein K7X08_006786 [Anisodus acutangulus]
MVPVLVTIRCKRQHCDAITSHFWWFSVYASYFVPTCDMDLDDIKSNLLSLRQLYGLLQNDREGFSNLTSDGLDYEARVMLKNLLDTTTKDVFKAHSEIIARQARVHSLPQPEHRVDAVKKQPLALSDVSKSSAVIQSCGKEQVVMDSTLPKEKQESILPITQTTNAQHPKFSFSASESGNKRKFCRICQRPKFEKPFMPCGKIESSENGTPYSTKVMALQEQQNSQFTNISWDIQQEALQSGSTESTKPKVLDLRCITSGAETVGPLSDSPANDLTQSVRNFSGLIRSVSDQNHDHFSTDDVIKQLELHISALQMDTENFVIADKNAAEHNFKPITNVVPQADSATPIKKTEGAVLNDKLSQTVAVLDDSQQLIITQCSQEPKNRSSSPYPGYTIPSIRISKFSTDQSPKSPESSSCQSNQLRQQKIVANIFPAEERDTYTKLDLVDLNPWQIQRGNTNNGQSIQSIVDQFESSSQLNTNNAYANSYSFQDRHNMETGVAAMPALLVIQNQNQNQMPSNERIRRLGKLNAARQMPAADILRNNRDSPGMIDRASKLTWSSTYDSRMDSPYSQQAIMRRSALNHKLGQFTPSQSYYVNLDRKPSKYPKNNNHMKRLRRRHLHLHLHGQESEGSHSSSPYSSSWTDSDKDDSLPRKIQTKTQYSDETSSYGGDKLYPGRDSSHTNYTVSSSCSSNEGYSSPIGSERAHEMISTSKSEGERSLSLNHSGYEHLEEPSYYSADSSSRRSSPASVYKFANSKKSKKHNGKWKKLKDKLAMVFHHHHHHHHHHHGKDDKGEERKTLLSRQRGKRFHGHYSTSKDESFGEKALEKYGKSAIDKQAGKKQKGDQFHTLAKGLMQHIQHPKKSKHSSSRPVDKGQHSDKKVINKFHWWQLLRYHRGLNKSTVMLGTGNKKGHSNAFPKKK